VYLYTFSDSVFSDGALAARIGEGYTGGKNINQSLDSGSIGRHLPAMLPTAMLHIWTAARARRHVE
jgi:hypothetical protein